MWLQKRKLLLRAVLTSVLSKDTIESYFVLLGMDEASAGALAWFRVPPWQWRRNGGYLVSGREG